MEDNRDTKDTLKEKINTDLPLTDNVDEIKKKGLELQNYFGKLGYYYNVYKLMYTQCDVELSRVRDEALLKTNEKSELLNLTNIAVREAYSKTNIKVKITLGSPDETLVHSFEGELTYHEIKHKLALYEYKMDRAYSKLMEVRQAIEYCEKYPNKMY